MAVGMSGYLAQKWLDALGNAVAFSVAQVYVQLHIGDPGAAGTTNTATETTRKAVSFGATGAASGGFVTMSNDVAVTWVGIAGTQDPTHFSLWDASTAGNYLGSGTITANGYTAGDTYSIAIGDIDLVLPVAV